MKGSKKLRFVSPNALGSPVALLLTFDGFHNSGLLPAQYPVAWKVITLNKDPESRAVVDYTGRVAFGITQIEQGNLVMTSAYREVEIGSSVDIIENGDNITEFENYLGPDPARGDRMYCKNKTGNYQNVSIGFLSLSGNSGYEPAFAWNKLGSKSAITTKFTPKLRIYATNDYQEAELIKFEIATDPLWEGIITDLPDESSFIFRVKENNGEMYLNIEG